ncbi:DUF2750 domain-containing protein [Shewanella schlegeliana]|uniref:DUF2750 domain-containing protein n=1 Tax=Shewanella schlegeliana TaxID=190308 RepID=A0ABS1T1J5_9GAMM|nr:DUF2750 domain-containing protein [Shewanella schlegeliana]MBL4914029.1 DUF2750 domain-containing protein [Shewanella schlegeliana]MCL1108588.1 DUF2750 domain-containing protein [Shewanella schlegeliana]GIU35724.1 hypothetical protein TUM4433_33490 [Shewanella schlegeliana]
MSQSASQARSFYRDVAKQKSVWGIRDDKGIPAPLGDNGKRAMPFWSTRSRAEKVVSTVDAYKGFEIFELSWQEFRDKWLIGLDKDGLSVGVNWSGSRATGYDVEPLNVKELVEYELNKQTGT